MKGKAQHGQKQTGVVNARDPLPDCPGRNVHPTKPTTTCCTSQEVAAEWKAKKRAMEEKIHEGEKAKEFLALMNINEDLNNEELLTENPQHLSTAICKHGRACLDDSDDEGEEFNFDTVKDGVYSHDLTVKPEKVKGKAKSKKAAKGDLRSDIKMKEIRLRSQEDGGREVINNVNKGVNVRFTTFDSAPKKYQNAGLQKDLNPKRAPEDIDPFQSGGLDDEDIILVQPSFPCTNNVAAVHSKHSDLAFPADLQHDRSCKNKVLLQLPKSNSILILLCMQNSKIQKATKLQHAKKVLKADADLGGEDRLNATEFIHDLRWAKVFIPTITHALYILQEPFPHRLLTYLPFLNFTSESPIFLATVQKTLNLSFPNVALVLTADDPLVVTAYRRINSQKFKLASRILEVIIKFFDHDEFINQPEKIRDYVHWAIKGDGELDFSYPLLVILLTGSTTTAHQAPDGFLQAQFIAPAAEQHLKYAKNSILYPPLDAKHPPKGLYTLLLIVEPNGLSLCS
ncbi:hypothetical protein L208DRAFT_1527612 [Tricholoma matsutake]|nr:hypothetical protein L208DRAFT_1527612 [Tricholoma matsutake 945]